MSRKVVISFYEDTPFADTNDSVSVQLLFRRIVATDWTLKQIEKLLDIGDCFSIKLLEGEHFHLVDFYSFCGYNEKVIHSIESIPSSTDIPNMSSNKYLYKTVRESNGENHIPKKQAAIYQRSRFEQGASGFSEYVIYCSNNPWIMLVFGYIFGKITDCITHLILKSTSRNDTQRIIFKAKKFYINAAIMLNCDYAQLQITDIHLKKAMTYYVRFRNIKGEIFNAECRQNGEIMKITTKKSVHATCLPHVNH